MADEDHEDLVLDRHPALLEAMQARFGLGLEVFKPQTLEWKSQTRHAAVSGVGGLEGNGEFIVLMRRHSVKYCEDFPRWVSILLRRKSMPALEASIAREI